MFEEKAEEWVKENMDCCRTDNSVNQPIPYFDEEERCCAKSAFIDGAEFGYHEGFKDCAKSRLNVTTISDCPIKDDWHYVKDGDFPTDRTEEKYLVALKSEYGGFFYETDIWCNSLHCFASNNPTKVYAWKEIVLPKEIE